MEFIKVDVVHAVYCSFNDEGWCYSVIGGFDELNHRLSLSMVAELVEATALLETKLHKQKPQSRLLNALNKLNWID